MSVTFRSRSTVSGASAGQIPSIDGKSMRGKSPVIPGKQYGRRDLLLIGWRRRWAILVPAIAVAGACAIWARSLPDKYRSDALILVVPQRVPESYVRSTVTTRIENRLHALTMATLSRTRLEPIIQELALYGGDRQHSIAMQDLVERMRN